eukprot:7310486-Prymnesium_polylepis.1
MQGQVDMRRACDEDGHSVWVWEGGTGRLGRFGKREGGRPGWQYYNRPSTHTYAHTCTYTPRDRE